MQSGKEEREAKVTAPPPKRSSKSKAGRDDGAGKSWGNGGRRLASAQVERATVDSTTIEVGQNGPELFHEHLHGSSLKRLLNRRIAHLQAIQFSTRQLSSIQQALQ